MWRIKQLVVIALLLCTPALALAGSHKHHRKPKQASWFSYRVFVPSRENLVSQNTMIDELHLPRIQDKFALHEIQNVRISPKLEEDRRYARPWVDAFLQELGTAYHAKFNDSIQVNSAVRTIKTQLWLLRWNHNAAPVHGEIASAHLAGVAVDLQRRGLTQPQIHFIQQYLLGLNKLGFVIVEEELKQPCFHIVVTGEYPYPPHINFVVSSEDQQKVINGIINPTASPTN
jgi:Family of unknown function (DUF5715)